MRNIGFILIVVGMMVAAGSAGDCDGACGPGNSLGTTLMVAAAGIFAMIVGALAVFSAEKE